MIAKLFFSLFFWKYFFHLHTQTYASARAWARPEPCVYHIHTQGDVCANICLAQRVRFRPYLVFFITAWNQRMHFLKTGLATGNTSTPVLDPPRTVFSDLRIIHNLHWASFSYLLSVDGAVLRIKLNNLCREIPGSLKFIIHVRYVILYKTAVWKFMDSLFQRHFKHITMIHISWNCKCCMNSLVNGQKCTSSILGSRGEPTSKDPLVIVLLSRAESSSRWPWVMERMYVSPPPNSHLTALTSNVILLGCGDFRR